MRRLVGALLLAALVSGCEKAQPILAGGKPVIFWVAALDNPDPKIRKTAVMKLGNVGSSDASAYPAVARALGDKDAGVRCEAILSLLKFGAIARDAVPDLAALQQRDRDARVRSYAAKALEHLQSLGDMASK